MWARLERLVSARRRLFGWSAALLTMVAVGATIVLTVRPDADVDVASIESAPSPEAETQDLEAERAAEPIPSGTSTKVVPRATGAVSLLAGAPAGTAIPVGGRAAPFGAGLASAGGGGGVSPVPAELRRGTAARSPVDGGVLPRSPLAPSQHSPHLAASDGGVSTGRDKSAADRQHDQEHDKKAERTDGGVTSRARHDDSSDDGHGSRRSSRAEDGEEFRRVTRFVATGGAILKGRVLEAETERPVANAIIEARMGGSFIDARSDAAGLFRIVGMAPSSRVAVWVQSDGNAFIAEHIDVSIPGEGETADAGTIHVLRANEFAGNLGGWLGMLAGRRSGSPAVSAVNPWLPAERAGVQVGDKLVSVDGRDVRELGTRGINYLLRGPVGSKVTLVVQTAGAAPRKVTLERVQR